MMAEGGGSDVYADRKGILKEPLSSMFTKFQQKKIC